MMVVLMAYRKRLRYQTQAKVSGAIALLLPWKTMKLKKPHPKRAPSNQATCIQQHKAARARVDRICPSGHELTARALNKPTRYLIDSVEMEACLVSATGSTPPQRARVTFVTDSLTGCIMAATAHFEPDYDLENAGGAAGYNSIQHAAAEIQHFRSLFPGLIN